VATQLNNQNNAQKDKFRNAENLKKLLCNKNVRKRKETGKPPRRKSDDEHWNKTSKKNFTSCKGLHAIFVLRLL